MLNRRSFLHATAAAGLFSALPQMTLAATNDEHRLVVILQRGGMDALDAVQPWGDPAFKLVRPADAGMAPAKAFVVDDMFAFHAALKPLGPLLAAKELAVVHAVSTPYRERSHFEAQDFLERGSDETSSADTGWLNRLITLLGGRKINFAADIGSGSSLILQGPAQALNMSPDADLSFWSDSAQFLKLLYKDDPAFAAVAANLDASQMQGAAEGTANPRNAAQDLSRFAGQLLKQDCRIAAYSIYGWDTHAAQQRKLEDCLEALAVAITTLKAELGPVWEKTLVVVASEFGRTVRFNGTGGTDHGTGGAAFFAGGLLANGAGGRVLTKKWPGLADGDLLDDRDLQPTDDVRRYIGWAVADLFDLPPGQISRDVFPGVEMGERLRMI